MITLEQKKSIQDIINTVSHGKCESYWETTLLRGTVGLTDAEVLGVIMNMEMEFDFKTNAYLYNIKHIKTVGDIYRLFNINYIQPPKKYKEKSIGYG